MAVPDDWRGKRRYLMSYDADTVTFERIGIASQSIPQTSLSLGFTMDRVNGEWSGFSSSVGFGPAAFTTAAGTGGDTHFSLFGGLKAYLGDGPSNSAPTALPPYIYQSSRTKWWTRMSKIYSKTEFYTTVAMNQYQYNYGLLYTDEGYDYLPQNGEQDKDRVLDSYSNPFDEENWLGEEHNSLTGIGYDDYVVSGEGIMGSFTANLWEEGNLPRQGAVIDYGTGQELLYMNQDPVTNERDKIHFTFSGQRFSSPQLPAGTWDIAPKTSGYDDPLTSVFRTGNTPVSPSVGWYDPTTNQAGSPSVIRYYTNQELYDAFSGSTPSGDPSLEGFMEYRDFTDDRINNDLADPDGIGGFMITNSAGVTYHYALPVYQFEQISGRDVNDGDNEEFFVDFQVDK